MVHDSNMLYANFSKMQICPVFSKHAVNPYILHTTKMNKTYSQLIILWHNKNEMSRKSNLEWIYAAFQKFGVSKIIFVFEKSTW